MDVEEEQGESKERERGFGTVAQCGASSVRSSNLDTCFDGLCRILITYFNA